MHGSWKLDEDIVIVALRLGTEFGWARIGVEFNKFFPNAPATRKDIESRYNKTLKPELDSRRTANVADVIDDYRHDRVLPLDQKHAGWVRSALKILADYPEDRIIKVNPEIEEGPGGCSMTEQLRYALPDIQPDVPYEQHGLLQQNQHMGDQANCNYLTQQDGFRSEEFQDVFGSTTTPGQLIPGSEQAEELPQELPVAPGVEMQGQGTSLYGFYGSSGYSGAEEMYSRF